MSTNHYFGAPDHLRRVQPGPQARMSAVDDDRQARVNPVGNDGPALVDPVADDPQARVDAIQAAFRADGARRSIRREPPPVPAALVPTNDPLSLRLAEELAYARRMLDAMGDSLAADAGMLARHGVALQSIDICGQILGHVADVIGSIDPAGAVERIGMCELKARLKRQSIG